MKVYDCIIYLDEDFLLNLRERKINGTMNKIINKLYSMYSKKKLIIMGYNEGWKQNINLGKEICKN